MLLSICISTHISRSPGYYPDPSWSCIRLGFVQPQAPHLKFRISQLQKYFVSLFHENQNQNESEWVRMRHGRNVLFRTSRTDSRQVAPPGPLQNLFPAEVPDVFSFSPREAACWNLCQGEGTSWSCRHPVLALLRCSLCASLGALKAMSNHTICLCYVLYMVIFLDITNIHYLIIYILYIYQAMIVAHYVQLQWCRFQPLLNLVFCTFIAFDCISNAFFRKTERYLQALLTMTRL